MGFAETMPLTPRLLSSARAQQLLLKRAVCMQIQSADFSIAAKAIRASQSAVIVVGRSAIPEARSKDEENNSSTHKHTVSHLHYFRPVERRGFLPRSFPRSVFFAIAIPFTSSSVTTCRRIRLVEPESWRVPATT